jgi:hypothetical protein
MKRKTGKIEDPLLDEVRKRREDLIKQHGGLRSWVKHLQELQKAAPAKPTTTGGSPKRPRRRGGRNPS